MRSISSLMTLGVTFLAAPLVTLAQTPSTPQVFKSLVGKTLDFETPTGVKASGVYSADGTAKMAENADKLASGKHYDSGKWRLTDDSVCVTWKNIRGGQEACLFFVPDGKQVVLKYKDTGTVSSIATVH